MITVTGKIIAAIGIGISRLIEEAMAPMSTRYDLYNAFLTNIYDRMQRGKLQVTPEFQKKFVNHFITRSDAQNYMVLGDPAARLRISTN